MNWDDLSPWERMRYCAAPSETVISVGSTPTLLVAGNPYRFGLIFQSRASPNAFVSTSGPLLSSGGGFSVDKTTTPLQLLARDWGSIVQLPWLGQTGGGGSISVIEVILVSWPGEQPKPAIGTSRQFSPTDHWPDRMASLWRSSPTFARSALSMPSAAEVDAMFATLRNGRVQ